MFFNNSEIGYDDRFVEPIINFNWQGNNAIAMVRRIELDFGLVLVFVLPVCTLINRSSISLAVKSCELPEQIIRPHEKEFITTY
jgi:hypothetical protein